GSEWIEYNGNCYYWSRTIVENWFRAELTCQKSGGDGSHRDEHPDAQEHTLLTVAIGCNAPTWIGLEKARPCFRQPNRDHCWVWMDRSPTVHFDWASGQTVDRRDAECVILDGQWKVVNCYAEYGYICKRHSYDLAKDVIEEDSKQRHLIISHGAAAASANQQPVAIFDKIKGVDCVNKRFIATVQQVPTAAAGQPRCDPRQCSLACAPRPDCVAFASIDTRPGRPPCRCRLFILPPRGQRACSADHCGPPIQVQDEEYCNQLKTIYVRRLPGVSPGKLCPSSYYGSAGYRGPYGTAYRAVTGNLNWKSALQKCSADGGLSVGLAEAPTAEHLKSPSRGLDPWGERSSPDGKPDMPDDLKVNGPAVHPSVTGTPAGCTVEAAAMMSQWTNPTVLQQRQLHAAAQAEMCTAAANAADPYAGADGSDSDAEDADAATTEAGGAEAAAAVVAAAANRFFLHRMAQMMAMIADTARTMKTDKQPSTIANGFVQFRLCSCFSLYAFEPRQVSSEPAVQCVYGQAQRRSRVRIRLYCRPYLVPDTTWQKLEAQCCSKTASFASGIQLFHACRTNHPEFCESRKSTAASRTSRTVTATNIAREISALGCVSDIGLSTPLLRLGHLLLLARCLLLLCRRSRRNRRSGGSGSRRLLRLRRLKICRQLGQIVLHVLEQQPRTAWLTRSSDTALEAPATLTNSFIWALACSLRKASSEG
uniref:C-type lectin domain-containing protein n=1 Tax=Macrostomum lignano TaxID=282301 RepID=A0A1I8IJK5_9PLAT